MSKKGGGTMLAISRSTRTTDVQRFYIYKEKINYRVYGFEINYNLTIVRKIARKRERVSATLGPICECYREPRWSWFYAGTFNCNY